MAKKYKSAKLAKQPTAVAQKPVSAFGKLANRLADSKKKKIQKLTDTQKRLLQSKKNNKMMKVSKKAKKFALLDEEDPNGDGAQGLGLTHRGVNVRDLKQFDDVNLNESDLENDEEFDNLQEKMNFAGFEATDNLLEQKNTPHQNNRPKTQNEIYKQIIQKSKAYKMVRQQQYEDNFNRANQLDEGFENLVSQLKFRNKDQQLLERIEHGDPEYDKLMNELKEDERVVSNKVVEKSEKATEKIRKKKNEQLNKLMRDSEGEEDIRGWVDGEAESQGEGEIDGDSEEDQQGEGEEGEESYDELDEVDLSSEEEEDEGEGEDVQGEEDQEEEGDGEQIDGEEGDYSEQKNDSEDQDDQDQDQDDQQQESQSPIPPKKNHKPQPQTNKAPEKPQPPSRQNPQKKVKLNFLQ